MTDARILIVEDRSLTAKHLQLSLAQLGYTTCGVAASGDEAVEKARETNPDLILMDVMLAGETDGTEAAKCIKSFLDVPIIFLTAHSDAAIKERVESSDPAGYLLKPFREEELQATIEMSLYKQKMQKLLRESEEKLDLALLGADLCLWSWDSADGKIVRDHRWAEKLGNTAHRQNEKEEDDVWEDVVHPEDRSAAVRAFGEHIDGLRPGYEAEYRLRTKSGEWEWVLERGRVMESDEEGKPRRVAGICLNNTDFKRIEKALRESEAKFGILFEKSRDAVMLLEGEGTGIGKIVSVNPAATEMYGYLSGDLTDLHISDLDSPEEVERLPERMEKMAAGEWIKEVIARRKRSGTSFLVESHAGIVEFSGHRYILAIDRDVTEERRARDLLIRSERLKAVGDMATGMAHHFTNMLQVVMGGASVALMKMESGELADTQSWLNKILMSAQWGAQTVRHLLEFVRLGTEESRTPEVFDLSDAVRQALDMAGFFRKSESERNGIEITITPVLEEGCMVRGSKTELFEATANLIKNAVEAMPDGGTIRVETNRSGGRVVLRVTDEGVGISEENLPKIFEPFFTTKGIEASGMGLAGSYGIVTRHQGTISCESEPGKGTTFTVGLPPAGTESVRAPAYGVPEVTAADLTILVIDDVEPILLMLGEALTEMGQKVFACRSGQEGLDLLREQSVDAVVSDLGMPGLNGWEVGKKVKEMFREKGVRKPPFIMLSGWTGLLEETEKIAESGVDAVVGKPVDAFKLLHVIQGLIETKRRGDAGARGVRVPV